MTPRFGPLSGPCRPAPAPGGRRQRAASRLPHRYLRHRASCCPASARSIRHHSTPSSGQLAVHRPSFPASARRRRATDPPCARIVGNECTSNAIFTRDQHVNRIRVCRFAFLHVMSAVASRTRRGFVAGDAKSAALATRSRHRARRKAGGAMRCRGGCASRLMQWNGGAKPAEVRRRGGSDVRAADLLRLTCGCRPGGGAAACRRRGRRSAPTARSVQRAGGTGCSARRRRGGVQRAESGGTGRCSGPV